MKSMIAAMFCAQGDVFIFRIVGKDKFLIRSPYAETGEVELGQKNFILVGESLVHICEQLLEQETKNEMVMTWVEQLRFADECLIRHAFAGGSVKGDISK